MRKSFSKTIPSRKLELWVKLQSITYPAQITYPLIFFRTGSSFPLAPPNVVYYNCVRFHQYCFICLGENCAYDKCGLTDTETYGLMDTDIWTDGHRHMDWQTQTEWFLYTLFVRGIITTENPLTIRVCLLS